MTLTDTPLISCILPTHNRRAFVPRAIDYFLRQDYQNRELLIVDDGDDPVADLAPDDPRVRYVRQAGRLALGAKRNRCVELAQGDLIMHWDDDDWYASNRITRQVAALRAAGAEICGLRQMLFYEPATGAAWLYSYPPRARPWLAGGSLLYTRALWRRAPFPNVPAGEDTRFVWERDLSRAAIVDDYSWYVASIHPANTSPKRRSGACWRRWPGDLRSILGADYDTFCRPLAAAGQPISHAGAPAAGAPAQQYRIPEPHSLAGGRHKMLHPSAAVAPLHQDDKDTPAASARASREQEGERMRLNLGCYDALLEGYINVDLVEGPGITVADLRARWPWNDGAAEKVRAWDIIEHLPDKIHTMNELWRVLAPGGTVEIAVPTTDGVGAFQDPTHVSFWNRRSFLYYEDGNPYRERFARFYGISARFRVLHEQIERTADGPRLTITLQAVKE